ncbi:MAG: hypothetical protein MR278_01780 [Bacteroidales bacterium]|nr:hypothetical protein [Anaerotignum sp.]MCI5678705.1 hypothetical protein [Bacteroidales bacterium]MDY3925935.1 hypothetical protein [Anaerotignum sp.]
MAVSKKEMIHLLRQMGNSRESVEWFRQRNADLRETMNDISPASPQMGETFSGGRKGDSVGRKVARREDLETKIAINERAIERRMMEFSDLARVIQESLTAEEREVLWLRHGERLRWEQVRQKVHASRSKCFRLEEKGLERLCKSWDRYLENKESEG